jgi:hypothetical protein
MNPRASPKVGLEKNFPIEPLLRELKRIYLFLVFSHKELFFFSIN